MSIYAGIPSGAYNSQAAMLYGGMGPGDVNTPLIFNMLIPFFTRNNIVEERIAHGIAEAVSDYIKAAMEYKFNALPGKLLQFWQEFSTLSDAERDQIRKALNYIRRKKRIPNNTVVHNLASAGDLASAMMWMRAIPPIGEDFPMGAIDIINLDPSEVAALRAKRATEVGPITALNLAVPVQRQLISPTLNQVRALQRRQLVNRAVYRARQRSRARALEKYPILDEKKRPMPPALEAYMKAMKERRYGTFRKIFGRDPISMKTPKLADMDLGEDEGAI